MKVFISYSSIDEDQARLVANILDDIDVQYFFDKKDISWGNVVNSDISEGISESNALILILSPASIKSQWVSFEIGFATALNKKVLPYLTHPSIDVPGFLQRLKYITKKEDIRDYFLSIIDSEENKQSAESLYLKGSKLFDLSKYTEALACFNKANGIDPKHFFALFDKGRILLILGSFEEAIEVFKKAEKINPNEENIYTNIGNCLNELKKFDEALIYLDKALNINPNNTIALTNKVKSLGNLGEHIEGRKISEKIVKINPLDDMAWNNIGASYGELGEYNKAIEFCTKALSINPSNIKAKNNIQRYSQLRTNQK